MSALLAQGVRVAYDGRPAAALDRIEVSPGEAVGLVGPNGSGKSTLLRVFALVEAPGAGTVALGGAAVGPGDRERARARLGVTLALPQPYLFVGTARSNVERGLAARGVPRAERRRRAAEALEELGVSHLAARDAKRLSSGESARVALARALVLETPVLLLDEPFANLDPGAVPLARDAVARRLARGTAVVLAAVRSEDLRGLAAREVGISSPPA